MSISYLPKTITKLDLFEEAQRRFQKWVDMYADPNISAQYMYEDMSCSCYSGSPEDDFPDEVKAEQDSVIRYQYDGGSCFFILDGIEITVFDLRDMRKDPSIDLARYSDVCVLAINYKDEDGMFLYHIIPAWLYGSRSDDFNEGKPVDDYFIKAAREYIKEHNITKEMQEVQN